MTIKMAFFFLDRPFTPAVETWLLLYHVCAVKSQLFTKIMRKLVKLQLSELSLYNTAGQRVENLQSSRRLSALFHVLAPLRLHIDS